MTEIKLPKTNEHRTKESDLADFNKIYEELGEESEVI